MRAVIGHVIVALKALWVAIVANPLLALVAALALVAVAFGKSLGSAIRWQDQMADVKKTTGLAGDALKKVSNDLLEFSTRTATSRDDLARIAATAGQLGIAKEDITGILQK